LIWLDRRSFRFLLLCCGGPSRRFRFPVGIATVRAVVGTISSFWLVRRLFWRRGEPSSATHRCGTGPVDPVPSASAVTTVLFLLPRLQCPVPVVAAVASLVWATAPGQPSVEGQARRSPLLWWALCVQSLPWYYYFGFAFASFLLGHLVVVAYPACSVGVRA
jgi:hypothetical protein